MAASGPKTPDLKPHQTATLTLGAVAKAMPGGAWFLYWWQSWPGFNTKATMPDGTAMKNWWVYLYY